MTNHEACLNEFRDASAAVRLAFAALSEAREVQIIANRAHADCNQAYVEAQSRLDAADAALLSARADDPAPADISPAFAVAASVTDKPHALFGVPFNQMFANGAVTTEQAD
jgi:hypothetical protein